jgi:hypothetical protein
VGLNLYFAFGFCREIDLLHILRRPFIVAAASTGISYGIYLWLVFRFGERSLFGVGGVLLTGVLYLVLGCMLGAFDTEDVLAVPMGTKLAAVLGKVGLLREKKK